MTDDSNHSDDTFYAHSLGAALGAMMAIRSEIMRGKHDRAIEIINDFLEHTQLVCRERDKRLLDKILQEMKADQDSKK